MSNELLRRLRGYEGAYRPVTGMYCTMDEAADHIEALEADLAGENDAYDEVARLSHRFRSERDAEAALADQLAEALMDEPGAIPGTNVAWTALSAWRARRSVPVEETPK